MNSYFGRLNYIFREKYLVTFTGRADGSSKFSETNKFGYFPSAALAWRVSEEEFIKNIDFILNLKLRASAGATGNSEIAPYASLSLLGSGYAAILNNTRVTGVGTNRLANPDLKWEKTTQYDIVRMWGDVPLITTPVDAASPDLLPSRTAAADVYDQIVSDLVVAETSSLPWTDNTGRVSLGAVKSLLSKVYLTMAGQPMNLGASYFQLAADKAGEVITSANFSLFPTYHDLHTISQENRGEHIFQLQYLGGVADNAFQASMLPNFKGVSYYGTEIGSTVPVIPFYQSYETGNKRAVDREGFFYTSYYNEGNGALKPLGAPYIFKHFDIIANGTAGTAGTGVASLNYPLIRYAEVLLIFAEAQNEVGNGPNATAYNALKAIRDRAELATPTQASFNQASFREAVWRERWYELSYEIITWFDMLRLRKGFNVTTKQFVNLVGYVFPDNGEVVEDKNLLLPLPTAEMRNNPNLKPNNPGY